MLLKQLTELNGVSGNEDSVREFLKAEVIKHTPHMTVDSIGNLIAFKKGKTSCCKVMLSAHMDEVGFMVTGYGEGGVLKFQPVGGVDARILPGKRVTVGEKRIPGVIGARPIHMQEPDERTANVKLKNLYIDIGAESKDEAEKLAPLGEYIAFESEYREFGDGCVKAKALDDRVGCAALLEALQGEYDFDLYACFTVQEEVGLRGAEVAAYRVEPDIVIVLEGTTCSDVPGVEKYDQSTILGNGAALTLMDRTSYADKELVAFLADVARKEKLAFQYKQTTTGGNDAGRIQRVKGGVKIASLSVPCRYIHSPVSVMSLKDYESYIALLKAALTELSKNPKVMEQIRSSYTL